MHIARNFWLFSASFFTFSSLAATALADPPRTVDLTTLRILHDKHVITDAEYEAALTEIGASTGDRGAADANTVVVGKWSTTFYGFVEADSIVDTTQSFSDAAGNAQVQRPNPFPLPPPAIQDTYTGDHGRTQFSIRNSRFGFRLRAPETHDIRTSALVEIDFLGSQNPIAYTSDTASRSSENAYFTSPAMRARHAYLKLETPVIDLLFGQTWALFGWQPVFQPNTVEIQGVPGEIYARTPQIRLSKTIKSNAATVDFAVALNRPPERDSMIPALQGGAHLAIEHWRGMKTNGATATQNMPASIAVTGDARQYSIPEFQPIPQQNVNRTSSAIAVDGFFPVIPTNDTKRGNALSLTGEVSTGYGFADMFSGLTGGMQMPHIPNTTGLNPAPTYPQNIDDGLVVYDLNGQLHPIQWTSFMVGAEYYLPGLHGRAWLSANYSRMQSANSHYYARPDSNTLPNPQEAYFVPAAQVRDSLDWFDVNFFADVAEPVRLGFEYANFHDHYVDGVSAINHRFQLSGFFLF
jgi:hypothetical protein